jgi:sporulation protein YlmC with PRC-barrel domain
MEGSSFENIRASRVEGTEVYTPSGEHLGQIDDLVIGKRDGEVKYAIMSFGGFLGIGEEYHPMPWNTLDYDPEKGGYVVNMTKEQLRDAPHYGRQTEPDWADPAYGRRINDYYGVPPFV